MFQENYKKYHCAIYRKEKQCAYGDECRYTHANPNGSADPAGLEDDNRNAT